MEEQIFTLAAALGKVPEGERDTLRQLCALAETELKARLRTGVTAADCAPAFTLAAAWLALAGLGAGDCMDGVAAFTAGDLSIRGDGVSPLERSEGLRRQAELVMAPYLEDRGFTFQGVRG